MGNYFGPYITSFVHPWASPPSACDAPKRSAAKAQRPGDVPFIGVSENRGTYIIEYKVPLKGTIRVP